MKKAYVVTGTITVLVGLSSQACTLGSDTYITSEPAMTSGAGKDAGAKDGSATTTAPAPGAGGGAACSGGSFATPDVTKLTACGDGKGHCYDKAKTPFADMLVACPDASQVCVPDEVLSAGGQPLKTCQSIIGDGGGCITMSLIPEMEKQGKAFLKQATCDANQVCAPCIDQNNAATPFCKPVGVYGECTGGSGTAAPASDGGTSAPKPLPGCCTTKGVSNGVCISESLVPADKQSDAPVDSCSSGNKCVPKSMFEGKAATCNSGLLGKGVCLDSCFNEMMGFASMIGVLGKDRCGDTEVCVPCTFAGSDTPGCG